MRSARRLWWLAAPLVYAALTALTWNRWATIGYDSGREAYVPLRLLAGQRIYRDFAYSHGPLAPALNALVYAVFGATTTSLVTAGTLAGLACVLLLQRLGRRASGSRAIASAASCLAIATLFFIPGGGTYPWPYGFGALYGLAFSLGGLAALTSGRARWTAAAAGALFGAATACKAEFAPFAALGLLGYAFAARRAGDARARAAIASIAWLAGAAAILAPFFAVAGFEALKTRGYLLAVWVPPEWRLFLLKTGGWADLPSLAPAVIASLAALGALLAAAWHWGARGSPLARAGAGFAAGAAVGALIPGGGVFALASALILGAVALALFGRRAFVPALSAPVAAALVLTPRSMWHADALYAAFNLPLAFVMAAALASRAVSPRARLALAGALVGLGVPRAVDVAREYRRGAWAEVHTDRGTLVKPARTAEVLNVALREIASRTTADQPVLVLPEGGLIDFLAGRTSPIAHDELLPGLPSRADVAPLVAKLEASPPKLVLTYARRFDAYGIPLTWEQYFPELPALLARRYRRVPLAPPAGTILTLYERAE